MKCTGRCSKPVALVAQGGSQGDRSGTSAASECGRHDDSPAERDRQKHGANKTTTAFIKANKKAFISYGLPEDDLTAAAVEHPPLLSWHSPIPLEVAEASAR